MSDDNKTPMRAPSVPGRQVEGPADLVVRMNESTSEDWDMVPLPARQQLGWHEDYERAPEHAELKDYHDVAPQELLHSPLLAGADQDTALNLTEPVTYHLEATEPPAEPSGAPGTAGYNNANRGIPAAEGYEQGVDEYYSIEQGSGVRTFRLAEGVALDEGEQAKVDGTGPYIPGEPRLAGEFADTRNQSDDTRQRTVQTPSVNDPYRNPDGSLKDPREVQAAAPAYPDSDFGSKDLVADETVVPKAAVETEGAKAEPDGDQQTTPAAVNEGGSGDVPDGSVAEVMKWVGDDKSRAEAALKAEQSKDDGGRSTLVNQLKNKIDG